ncbi:DUF3138 family protein [Rivibacter subsaxonicus]|uniref:Uncharacterized protein DUF3138 n=1 Tax=Rivibacter subsaxonicus TaxID=457575 RepID=A0A4Q7VF20_9BURK|nr:DUF3138 family protein [Rivibacter subsaxonicus]RZT93828.1 uncharacterized protein DUF3138 [Rivibacter subsaxonicus]
MKHWKLSALALALGAAFPGLALAQTTNDELLKELRELKARVGQLEQKLKEAETKAATAPAAAAAAAAAAGAAGSAQWGMTPEQVQEFNRIAVKTEATEDNLEAWGLKGLTISGYMDPAYIYNQRQSRSGFQFLNSVGDDGYNYDNSYFGTAMIDFQKETESGTKWRLTLAPNRGAGAVFDGSSIVHEASVSIPLTDLQTRMIAGQIPDWSGYEYLPATQNKLITHNLLFDFTLPTAYTGAGLEVTRGKWLVKGMLANMNSSKNPQGESSPVFAYRVDYSRGEFQGFGFAGVHGKAANFSENVLTPEIIDPITGDVLDPGGEVVSQRNSHLDLFEFDAYFIRGDWTVQGQLSLGRQRRASITADPVTGALRDAEWYGASALAAYKFTPRLEGIVRGDYLHNRKNGGGLLGFTASDDRNGIGPGWSYDETLGTWFQADPERGVNRTAVTLGLSYLFNLNTTFKAEYRFDQASEAVFLDVKSGSYKRSNNLLGASVVVFF